MTETREIRHNYTLYAYSYLSKEQKRRQVNGKNASITNYDKKCSLTQSDVLKSTLTMQTDRFIPNDAYAGTIPKHGLCL